MMIKRIIFDQDDTLVTFSGDIFDTLDYTFEELNYPFSSDKKQIIINSVKDYEKHYSQYKKEDMYDFVNTNLNEVLPSNWIDIWLEKLSNREITLEPFTKEILEYLKQKYELVILTNWFTYSQVNILKKAGIYDFFDKVIGTEEVYNKPNIESYIKAIGTHKPEECMMIGDTFDIDILGAYYAGLETIWYNRKHKEVEDNYGITEIDNLEDLKNYL